MIEKSGNAVNGQAGFADALQKLIGFSDYIAR
jgi:hypothetical protein